MKEAITNIQILKASHFIRGYTKINKTERGYDTTLHKKTGFTNKEYHICYENDPNTSYVITDIDVIQDGQRIPAGFTAIESPGVNFHANIYIKKEPRESCTQYVSKVSTYLPSKQDFLDKKYYVCRHVPLHDNIFIGFVVNDKTSGEIIGEGDIRINGSKPMKAPTSIPSANESSPATVPRKNLQQQQQQQQQNIYKQHKISITPYSTMSNVQVDINPSMLGRPALPQAQQPFIEETVPQTEDFLRKKYKFDFGYERSVIANEGITGL